MTAKSRLKFDVTWEDPGAARGPELRATWARLKISIDDRPVTSVAVRKALGVRDEIYGPLYPIAEWLTANWWFLQSEPYSRSKDRLEYVRRHDLRFAGEGFYLPALLAIPDDEGVRLTWEPTGELTDAVRFIAPQGDTYLTQSEFHDGLRQFIQVVVDRLGDLKIGHTPLQEEWRQICDLETDDEALAFCTVAAKLGQDPFAMDDQFREGIIASSGTASLSVISEMSEVSTIEGLQDDLAQLYSMIDGTSDRTVRIPAPSIEPSLRLLAALSSEAVPPWERGYKAAHHLREVLGIQDRTFRSIDVLVAAMAALFPAIDRSVVRGRHHRNEFLDAVTVVDSTAPRFFLLKSQEQSQRFALCRAIYRCAQPGGSIGLITQAESARQASGRAFAAEFLAPSELLRARVRPSRSGEVDAEDVEALADDFGVSRLVIVHQLYNHDIARVRDPVSGYAGWGRQVPGLV